jgi:DedD protein
MQGIFDEEEQEPVESRRDTELTLGPFMLVCIFLGLALLCGAFFGWGYIVGHRGSQAGTQPASDASSTSANSQPKPSATPEPSSAPQQNDAGRQPSTDAAAPTDSAAEASPAPIQPAVRPALPAAASAQQPAARPTGNLTVQPASAPALMVQIAAVSHAEDADVLANALRQRGYPVAEQRDPADSLIHVRIGPFASRDEANQWRLKLLNDGYNAIIQP